MPVDLETEEFIIYKEYYVYIISLQSRRFSPRKVVLIVANFMRDQKEILLPENLVKRVAEGCMTDRVFRKQHSSVALMLPFNSGICKGVFGLEKVGLATLADSGGLCGLKSNPGF